MTKELINEILDSIGLEEIEKEKKPERTATLAKLH